MGNGNDSQSGISKEEDIFKPQEVEKKKNWKVKIILLSLLGLFLLTGGGICFYAIINPCWNNNLHYKLAPIASILNIRYEFIECMPRPKKFLGPTYNLGEYMLGFTGKGGHYIKISIIMAFDFKQDFHEMVETEKAKVIYEIKHDIDPIKPVLAFTVNNTLSILTPDEITGQNRIEFLKKTLRDTLNDKLKELKPKYQIQEIYLPNIVIQ